MQARMILALAYEYPVLLHIGSQYKKGFGLTAHLESLALPDGEKMSSLVFANPEAILFPEGPRRTKFFQIGRILFAELELF